MIDLKGIEFSSTSDGEVLIKSKDGIKLLDQKDRDFIESVLITIRDRYPQAYEALSKEYAPSRANNRFYEFRIVKRFIRCNFGEQDTLRIDIDDEGDFQVEEVRCPLRGECKHEGVICKPKFNSVLSAQEKLVLDYKSQGFTETQTAEKMCLSPFTIHRHMENIRRKLNLHNAAELTNYNNKLKDK